MKKHNFSAGPSILPREVIEETAKGVLDFNGSGLSVMEISHRSKDFQAVMDEAVALFKELLNIPDGYSVLFLGGGASTQFCMVPYNFLEKKAAYLNTGVWAKKALKEAKGFGEAVEVASSAEATYTYIPKDYTIPADADYFHITTNNTIYGTEWPYIPQTGDVPLVCDMSSNILSMPVDVSKFGILYAGAQKNMAPAGLTVVIIREDDFLGPLKLDRLYQSGFQHFPLVDNTGRVTGLIHTCELDALKIKKTDKAVKYKDDKVYYIREDHSLEMALAAILRTNCHFLLVINKQKQIVNEHIFMYFCP